MKIQELSVIIFYVLKLKCFIKRGFNVKSVREVSFLKEKKGCFDVKHPLSIFNIFGYFMPKT